MMLIQVNLLADSRLTTSGISNTTTDLAMTGTNEGKKIEYCFVSK